MSEEVVNTPLQHNWTTKYSFPLHFLVVQTNINYQVTAVIICQEKNGKNDR